MFDARIVLKTRQIRSCFIRSRATCPFRDCLGAVQVPKTTDLGNRSRSRPGPPRILHSYACLSSRVYNSLCSRLPRCVVLEQASLCRDKRSPAPK